MVDDNVDRDSTMTEAVAPDATTVNCDTAMTEAAAPVAVVNTVMTDVKVGDDVPVQCTRSTTKTSVEKPSPLAKVPEGKSTVDTPIAVVEVGETPAGKSPDVSKSKRKADDMRMDPNNIPGERISRRKRIPVAGLESLLFINMQYK